jgi:hypothetical protein
MPLNTDLGNFGRETRDPSLDERESTDGERLAAIDQDEVETEGGVVAAGDDPVENEKDEPVTWMSLPHRRQLIILTLSRLSEPLVQTSLQVNACQCFCLLCSCSPLDDHRRICSTNSNHLMKASQTQRLLPKLA